VSILIFLIVAYLLFSIAMVPLFDTAGVEKWKALVPGVNFFEMSKIVGRKSGWYALWLLFPIVNIFIFVGLCVDLVRSFGRFKLSDSALAVVIPPVIFYLINRNKEDYLGPTLELERDYRIRCICSCIHPNVFD